MDSVPQELIDAIIDNVPRSSLRSCSLVAKRWRRKSQRRVLSVISFKHEVGVNRWCTDIPQYSDGISSYVRCVKVKFIRRWAEPARLNRMLGTLSSLTTLSMYATVIPHGLPGYISRGEFGKRITVLYLRSPHCTLTTITSMILSLPNLKELSIEECRFLSEELLPIHSVTPQRQPLDSLELQGYVGGIGEALAKFRFISTHLSLGVDIRGVEQLLMLSSGAVVELILRGVWFL
jgi:hypothetical protein